MNNLANLIRKLISEIHIFEEYVRQLRENLREYVRVVHEQKNTPPQVTCPIKIQFDEMQESKRSSESEEQIRIQRSIKKANWTMCVVTLAAFAAAACAAVFAWKGDRIADRALQVNQRAWIGIDGDIKIEQQSIVGMPDRHFNSWQINTTLSNYGAYPATKIFADFKIETGVGTIQKWKSNACDETLKKYYAPNTSADILFPKNSHPKSYPASSDPDKNAGPYGAKFLVGCIIYTDGSNSIRHTKVLYIGRSAKTLTHQNNVPDYYPIENLELWDSEAD